MKKLKVTVSGFVNTVFVGNDDEVYKFLTELKRQQINGLTSEEQQFYKKIKSDSFLAKKYANIDDRNRAVDLEIKSQVRMDFQNRENKFPLKIQIETVKSKPPLF